MFCRNCRCSDHQPKHHRLRSESFSQLSNHWQRCLLRYPRRYPNCHLCSRGDQRLVVYHFHRHASLKSFKRAEIFKKKGLDSLNAIKGLAFFTYLTPISFRRNGLFYVEAGTTTDAPFVVTSGLNLANTGIIVFYSGSASKPSFILTSGPNLLYNSKTVSMYNALLLVTSSTFNSCFSLMNTAYVESKPY